jgi:hypothetical protein
MPARDLGSDDVVTIVSMDDDTLRALEELADRLEDIASGEGLGRRLGRDEARVAAVAARRIRAIPKALAACTREAFAVGRAYGQHEVARAEVATESRALATLVARQAWGGGGPGSA